MTKIPFLFGHILLLNEHATDLDEQVSVFRLHISFDGEKTLRFHLQQKRIHIAHVFFVGFFAHPGAVVVAPLPVLHDMF